MNAYALLWLMEHVESGLADYKLEVSITRYDTSDGPDYKAVYIDGQEAFRVLNSELTEAGVKSHSLLRHYKGAAKRR